MKKQFYFFIDESGDPNFYAKRKRPLWTEPTFEPILMLGMIVVENRKALRKAILEFQEYILSDPLFNTIHSVNQANWYLHASQDHSDIRLKFIEFLREQSDIKFYAVIGRKQPDIFHNKHNGNATEFYFDLLNKLLSRYEFHDEFGYMLYLSAKQSTTQERFRTALNKALNKQSKKFEDSMFDCRIVASNDYPELSVVDYMLWTLKRYITSGDKRYYTALENKFVEIFDVYEDEGKGRIYNVTDLFDLSKASSYRIK